jgi:hypothetical protein
MDNAAQGGNGNLIRSFVPAKRSRDDQADIYDLDSGRRAPRERAGAPVVADCHAHIPVHAQHQPVQHLSTQHSFPPAPLHHSSSRQFPSTSPPDFLPYSPQHSIPVASPHHSVPTPFLGTSQPDYVPHSTQHPFPIAPPHHSAHAPFPGASQPDYLPYSSSSLSPSLASLPYPYRDNAPSGTLTSVHDRSRSEYPSHSHSSLYSHATAGPSHPFSSPYTTSTMQSHYSSTSFPNLPQSDYSYSSGTPEVVLHIPQPHSVATLNQSGNTYSEYLSIY